MVTKQPKLRSGRRRSDGDESPPDPRRHVVLLATFLFLVLEAGITKSFGVLLSPMVVQLDSNSSNFATMGVIFALPWSVEYMSVVFVKPLLNRIDPNKVSTAGGLIAGVAVTASSFTRTTWALGTLFFMFGVGESMILTPAIICLHHHFKTKFTFACSFAFIGSLVGLLFLPIATEVIMEAYGPSNALFILGGLCLNMIPIGLVVKSPKEKCQRISVSARKHLLETDGVGFTSTKEFPPEKSAFNTCHMECKVRQNPVYDKLDKLNQDESSDLSDSGNMTFGKCDGFRQQTNLERGQYGDEERTSNMKSLENHDNAQKGHLGSKVDIEGLNQRTHIWRMEWILSLKTFIRKAKYFLVFVLPCDFIGAFVLISWTIFIIPYAISIGITESQAVFVATMGGVGGPVARIAGSVVLHFHPNWVSGQYVVFCSLTFMMLFVQPLRASYMYILACSFLLGFGLYGSVSLVEPLLSTVVSPEVFPTAVSVAYMFKGVSGILTAYVSGSLFDLTGSFRIVFHILGGLDAINVGIALVLIIAIKKRSNTEETKTGNDNKVLHQ